MLVILFNNFNLNSSIKSQTDMNPPNLLQIFRFNLNFMESINFERYWNILIFKK